MGKKCLKPLKDGAGLALHKPLFWFRVEKHTNASLFFQTHPRDPFGTELQPGHFGNFLITGLAISQGP